MDERIRRALRDARERLEAADRERYEPIAIVGLGGRLPGAASIEEFWAVLRDGRDLVGPMPASREALVGDRWHGVSAHLKEAGWIDEVDTFDHHLFGISTDEATALDPQQRLLLEATWAALEDACVDPATLRGSRTGVFIGISNADFAQRTVRASQVAVDAYGLTGVGLSLAPGRIAYLLGLRGPALAVDTACSSSLVALHLAVESLRRGECDWAIVGGVQVILEPHIALGLDRMAALSPRARCRAFDASADGFVRGEGAVVTVLRRGRDAEQDGDPVRALVLGTAVNQDGASSGLTAPNGVAQREVIRTAMAVARITPDEVQAIEAHGTGTALGDPIELSALGDVFAGRATPVHLGSVKTNIGHLEAAAGLAGLVRLVLALEHEALPPHLHFEAPTPHVEWSTLPVQVPGRTVPWPRGPVRRVAGLSSFGFSGTNAHVVAAEAPVVSHTAPASADETWPTVVSLSARTREALDALTTRWRNAVAAAPFDGVAATAAHGRATLPHRRAVVAAMTEELAAALQSPHTIDGVAVEPQSVVLVIDETCPDDDVIAEWCRHVPTLAAAREAVAASATDQWSRQATWAALCCEWLRTCGITPIGVSVANVAHASEIAAACHLDVVGSAPRASVRVSLSVAPDAPDRMWREVLSRLAHAWVRGVDVQWSALAPSRTRRVRLPLYPFERHHFWPAPAPTAASAPSAPLVAPRVVLTHEQILERLQAMMAQAGAADDGPIPVNANLFTLGIDSIMLIQVRGLIAREFGVELDLAKFYEETSTLDRLAAWIAARQTDSPSVVAPPPAQTTLAPSTPAQAPARPGALPNRPGRAASAEVAAAQRAYLETFGPRYVARTAASRAHVARHRPHLATSRNLAGFRADWKEIVYQIVGGEGRGARLVDADGREYRDFTMGFGAALLGHNPDVVREALARELTRGFALGPLSDLAGDAAETVTRLTGVERVAFFNTGSEAVMNAVRIARTVRQRSRLVIFEGAYHGTFDGVLALDLDGESVPISPGTTRGMVEDVRILRYGDPASLEIIAREADTLAGVLVEPVQSRHPDLQPEWFLRDLRAITAARDVPLLFDEMITGFRSHPGGVQQRWSIQADLVTYGKVLGGGLPIGAVAGTRRYMDAVDGGLWQYGDASLPTAATTFTSGTFCNHPLSMAASLAVLRELERQGPALQAAVDRRTAHLCERINAACAAEGFPLRMVWFSSLFRFVFEADLELLFFHLLDRGFYVWEGRNCFLSTAHTDEDVDAFVDAVLDSLREMREGGLFRTRESEVSRPAASPVRDVPAAPAQRRIALVQETAGDDAAWHLHDARLLDGPIDLARLRRAYAVIVARHDSLRTGFLWRDGDLRQQVHEHVAVRLAVVERVGEDPVEVARSLLRPFDLTRPSLFRVTAARLGESRWLLVTDAHHLVCDGASLAMVVEELLRAYGGEQLPPVAQYPAFAEAHLAQLSGPDGDRLAAYWRSVFPAAPEPLALPTDIPRPSVLDTAGAALRVEVPPDVVSRLRALARASGATLYAVLLAAYQTWLARMAGADEVVIGVPVAGRPEPEHARTVGMFVATVPVRLPYAASDTVTTAVARAARTLWAAVEHGAYPFESLVQAIGGGRHPGRHPLFDTMFEFETGPAGDPTLDGQPLRPVPLDDGTAMFDLDIELRLEGDRLWLTFKYRTSLWRAETAALWCDSVLALLAAFGVSPDAPCGGVPLVSADQRRQLLEGVNQTRVPLPDVPVHERIRAQAEAHPTAVALTSPEGSCAYGALWLWSGQWAARLRAVGAGPESAVAIIARRSPVAIAATLGALRAGACYAPLDPSTPIDRLAEILATLRPVAVVGEPDLAAALPLPADAHWVSTTVVDAWSAADVVSNVDADPRVHGDQAAYVLFTSGSTGTPKGVVVSHRALSNHIAWYVRQFTVRATDVFLQKTVCTFDTSLTEIYAALTTGARLVLPAPDAHHDPAAIASLVRDEAVTILEDVPSFADLLVQEPALSAGRVRWHNPGGEALPAALARRCAAATGAQIANLYGPTEAAVDALCEVWDGTEHGGWVPIGRPVENTTAYVLDAYLEPVPVGVLGDLYVGGVQLARGYLGQPGLTADRFIPDPHGAPGARLYRTGDRAFRLADGRVVYAGRQDQQIKLRGQRIEPGDIEAVLRACPGVTEAVAGTWTRPDGTPTLVAWVHPQVPTDWHARLRRQLPAYMVPTHVMAVTQWPTLPSGKIDRRALPAPMVTGDDDAETREAVQTPTEAVVAAVFADVLGVSAIGRGDDFFLLGGHSLLAARTMARLRQHLDRDLPLRLLFAHPTVAALAAALDDEPVRMPLEPTPDAASHPLTGVQRGVWLACQQRGDAAGYVMAEAYECLGAFDVTAWGEALTMVVARHEALRTQFVLVDGEPRQRVCAPAPVLVQEVDTPEALEQRLHAPFRLETDLLLRTVVCRVSPDRHLVGLAMHHLVSDAWSSAVLADDLRDAYRRVRAGDRTPLPPLPLQYRDVAVREARRRAAGGEEADRRYWREALADLQLRPELPLDRPRPTEDTTAGGEHLAVLNAALLSQLDRWVTAAGASRLAGLLAAMHLLLHARTGVTDSVVGTVSAGRGEAAVEPLIGFFVNTLAVRTRVDAGQTVSAVLDQVRTALTGAVAHQDTPLDRIVTDLSPVRVAGRHPLFDVVVNVLHQRMADAGLADGGWPGAQMQRWPLPLSDAKFDLMLVAAPTRDGRELGLTLEYRTDVFDAATATRWVDEFRDVLAWVTSHPSATVRQFVTAWEDRPATQIARSWQGAAMPLPDDDLWTQFTRVVASRPDAPAVVDDGRVVTYRALADSALTLAGRLADAGVAPGAVVGVLGERSASIVAAMLGVIARGAVYVPLDPGAPDAHRQWVAKDAALRAVVYTGTAPSLEGLLALPIDDDAETGPSARASMSSARVSPEWPAYVMYTSGSTGHPKGIVVPHRAVTRLVWGRVGVPLGPQTRVAMASSPAFDASTFEVWGALLQGGTLVVTPRTVLLDPALLSASLHAQPVDVLWLTAGVFHALVSEAPEVLLRVPYLMAGGDVVRTEAVRVLRRSGYDGHVINGYGPTENTTFTTTFTAPASLGPSDVLPIGRAIGHTEVYVVTSQGRLAAVGEPGELWTGGLGLAHGYLSRPGLTAERFVPHPFSTTPGARLYRTGDRVRWRDDGTLEFLGRLDRQVKIRGFRVEPGEVEVALQRLPGIRAAVVDARPGPGSDRRLVAWVEEETPGAAAAAREHLQATLPAYLVPSVIGVVERWPLTMNGKVAVHALVEPDDRALAGGAPVETSVASDGVREVLRQVWATVLGRETVGVEDNFFALGGDSIQAIQVVTRAAERGVTLRVQRLFEYQTLGALAEAVARDAGALAGAGRSSAGPIGATAIQRWFLRDAHPAPETVTQSVRLQVHRDAAVLSRALAAVVAHHEAFRVRVTEVNGTRQLVLSEDPMTVPVASATDTCAPLDPGIGRVARAQWVGSAEASAQSLDLELHHLIVDGVSWRILVADLESALRQLAQGESVRLPEVATGLAVAGRWNEDAAARAAVDRPLVEFWRGVAGVSGSVQVDDATAPSVVAGESSMVTVLDAATTERLEAVVAALGMTLDAALIGAVAQVCAGGRTAFRLDVEGHGRETGGDGPDLSRTVGWFTALYPLALHCPAASDPIAWTRAAAEALRRTPDGGVTWGLLREIACVEELVAAHPSAVVVNYHGDVSYRSEWFTLLSTGGGSGEDGRAHRRHEVEVTAERRPEGLHVRWTAAVPRVSEARLTAWAEAVMDTLRWQTVGAGGERDRDDGLIFDDLVQPE